MAENNQKGFGEKTNEKRGQHRAKVVYLKCQCCGCRKKQPDMASPDICNDCVRKHEQAYQKNPQNPLGFGGLANVSRRKSGKKGEVRAMNFQEANKNGKEWNGK